MNYPAASSGVSKTTTGKTLRPKGRGIHPDGNKTNPGCSFNKFVNLFWRAAVEFPEFGIQEHSLDFREDVL